jgi:hypothetical protein
LTEVFALLLSLSKQTLGQFLKSRHYASSSTLLLLAALSADGVVKQAKTIKVE